MVAFFGVTRQGRGLGMEREVLRPVRIGYARARGAVYVIASAVGFGTLGILGKMAYAGGASTVTVLFLRFFLAGLLMTALMQARCLAWPHGRDLWLLIGLGALGYAGQAFCYFSALHHATAGLTALLLYLYPALVLVASAMLGRQQLTPIKAGLAAAALAGVLLTVSGGLSGSPVGIAFGLGAALIYTGYILIGEAVIPRTGAIPAATVVMLAAAMVFAAVTFAAGPRWPGDAAGWLAVLGIALLATVIPIVGFFAGMHRLGATHAATISTLEPVVTLVLAFLILHETLAPMQVAGAVLVIAAVAALTRVR